MNDCDRSLKVDGKVSSGAITLVWHRLTNEEFIYRRNRIQPSWHSGCHTSGTRRPEYRLSFDFTLNFDRIHLIRLIGVGHGKFQPDALGLFMIILYEIRPQTSNDKSRHISVLEN